jgi:XTP/dITP diphosphohydrolase
VKYFSYNAENNMQKLVIASGNQGKLRELSALLEPLDFDVHTQSEFNVPDVEETGTTFVENAIIKARNAALHTGLPAVADDSGIEVDALQGAPGVYSARFSAPDATDDKNNALLVKKLAEVPEQQRTARYRAVIVYMRHAKDPSPIICEGSWEGRIVLEPQGEGGFGYDPYFWLPTHGCTSAQLSAQEKNALSHRGQALRELVSKLTQ